MGLCRASWHVLRLSPGNLPARFARPFVFFGLAAPKHNPSRASPIDAARLNHPQTHHSPPDCHDPALASLDSITVALVQGAVEERSLWPAAMIASSAILDKAALFDRKPRTIS